MFYSQWDGMLLEHHQNSTLLKNHIHPSVAVKENIKKTSRAKIKAIGLSIDWTREFATTDPEYYKWTQWQFLKFFEHGMAYKAKGKILTGVQSVRWDYLMKTHQVVFVNVVEQK